MYLPFELKVEHLIAVQQEYPLFKPLNFTVQNQQILLLHGPNGIGKTTCLRTLAGLLPPAQGKIFWNKQIDICYRQEYLNHMTYLGHHTGVKLALTPTENLQLYLTLNNPCRGERRSPVDIQSPTEGNLSTGGRAPLAPTIDRMHLTQHAHTPCHSLSAGQQRRVALARLCLAQTPLWILDEPLTALDKEGIQLLQQLLSQHIANGGAVILTSHQYFAEATQTIELERWHTC